MPTIRLGLLTLPLAGLLVTWGAIATSALFDFPDAVVGPEEAALAYTSLGYFLSQFVGYVLGLTLLTVGVFALTVYLSEIRRERWTLVAMVLSILGIGLLLSYYGLSTYAVPKLGEAYLDGVQNAVVLANTIYGDPNQSVFYAAFLLYSASFILFGFGVWGSGALPKWAGALLALHAPLFSASLPDLFSVLGALLLVVGGGWITLAVLRRPTSREVRAEPESREPKPRARTGRRHAKPRYFHPLGCGALHPSQGCTCIGPERNRFGPFSCLHSFRC
jgi:hypothetical protein